MNPSAAPATFKGVSGSITVSITAFTIVFAVLAGLTAVIYAIKIFAGEDASAWDAFWTLRILPRMGRVALTARMRM